MTPGQRQQLTNAQQPRLHSLPLSWSSPAFILDSDASTLPRVAHYLHCCTVRCIQTRLRSKCESRRVSSSGTVVQETIPQLYSQERGDNSDPDLDRTCNKERHFLSYGTVSLPFRSDDLACSSATPIRCLVYSVDYSVQQCFNLPMPLLSLPAKWLSSSRLGLYFL